MDTLKELIELITPTKLKKINLIVNMDDKSMLKKMYIGYQEGKWKDDADAASALYGDKLKKDTFSKLKHDLTKKLIQIFPLINLVEDEGWEHRKAMWECYTTYHVANVMLRLTNASSTAREMMERIFEKCLYYEFTDLIIIISSILCNKYKSKLLDRAKAQYYEEITLRYLIIQTAEIKGSFFTNEIAGYYIKDKSVKPFVPIKALEYIHDLEQYTIEIPTQKVIYNKRLLEVLYYMTKYNYHKTIEVCESAILFFENQNFLNRASVRVFYMQAAVAYTYCRDFKEGYNKANRCLELVDEGHYNWFKTQELRLQLAIYAKQYQEAYTILRTVMKHGRFEKLPKPTAQWWVLNEGFLFVLKKIGLFVPEEGDMMHLRFHSFINKVQIWSNDKRGMNFSLHVLYLFYLITRKDGKYLDKYLDKLESLKQYVRRYANEDGMQRSKWMITILEKIGDSGFVPKTYLKDATIMQSINNLIHEPYDITDTNIEIEPVPFQDVYHYINQVLTNKMTVEDYEIAV